MISDKAMKGARTGFILMASVGFATMIYSAMVISAIEDLMDRRVRGKYKDKR